MVFIAIVIIEFLIKLYKKQGLSPSFFVIATYLLSTILSFVYLFTLGKDSNSYHLFSFIYYGVCLGILYIPLLCFSGFSKEFRFPPKSTKVLSYVLIFAGILSLYFTIVNFDFADSAKSWAEMRSSYYKETEEGLEASQSLLDRISWNFSFLLYLAMPLGVYQIAIGENKIGLLLIISSFSIVADSIVDAERQDLITWVAGAIASFLMFKDILHEKIKKKIRNIFIIAVGLILFLVLSISISRFNDSGFWSSFLGYAGVQPFNAAYFLEKLSNQAQWGRINFPFFTGTQYVLLINDNIQAPISLNIFGSIVGSFYLDFGYFTILFVCFFAFVFKKLIKNFIKKGSILAFYLYMTYFSIMFSGCFYFKFNSPPQVRIIILMGFILYIFEQINIKK